MKFENLISNFQKVGELLDSYESGDLLRIAYISESFDNIYKEFDKYNELKNLTIL